MKALYLVKYIYQNITCFTIFEYICDSIIPIIDNREIDNDVEPQILNNMKQT